MRGWDRLEIFKYVNGRRWLRRGKYQVEVRRLMRMKPEKIVKRAAE